MFGQTPEDDFINDPTRVGSGGRGPRAWALLLLLAAGIVAFVVWARVFEIEEVTSGIGRVIPSQRLQVVQSLEPGIVRSIDVSEGDIVVAGQTLMQIDDTEASALAGELREREAALLAEEVRLKAEVALNREPVFPEELQTRAGSAVLAEMDVLASRFEQLDNELEVLRFKRGQAEAELNELRATRRKLEAVVDPLREEEELTAKLAETGAVPRIELLRLRSRLAEMSGEILVIDAQEDTLIAALSEAESAIEVAKSAYALTARQRLARLRVELAVVREELRAARDRVTRTKLKAPIDGIVNTVSVTTVGEVIEPGEPLVEVVPIDDSLLILVDVLPKDVAFIRPGEKASVKITAYDYLVYGALEGEVERIGADTVQKPDGREFFQISIRTNDSELRSGDQVLPITPGMTAAVDIQTGQRSVLSYLLSPLLRAQSEALRER